MTIAIGAALFASIGAVLWVMALRDSSAAADVSLRGVTAEDLRSIGLELKVPDSSASVTEASARSVAADERIGGKVIETVLVNMTTLGTSEPTLAWAVNLDPASVTIETHGPPGYNYPSPKLTFAAVFVDAETGELISAPVLGVVGDPVKAAP